MAKQSTRAFSPDFLDQRLAGRERKEVLKPGDLLFSVEEGARQSARLILSWTCIWNARRRRRLAITVMAQARKRC
jgi:hypothetical protein